MSSNPPSWQQTAPGTSSSSAQPGATSATAQAPAQTNQQNIAAQDRLWSSKPLISQSPYLKNLTSVTNGSVPTPFTGYSAATEEILRRVRENGSAKVGMPGWEAAREQVLKNMATSDKILTPPLNSLNKRARGGVKARSGLQPGITGTDSISRGTTSIGSAGSPTESATAGASMGSARGRGRARGKGRNAGRSGKRKRDSDDEAIDLDVGRPFEQRKLAINHLVLLRRMRMKTQTLIFQHLTLLKPQSPNPAAMSINPRNTLLLSLHRRYQSGKGHTSAILKLVYAKYAIVVTALAIT